MKYFGTDGIRLEDVSLLNKLAIKTAYALKKMGASKVVVGYDARPNGKKIVKSLMKSFNVLEVDVYFIKIVPSACVSFLTVHNKADFGVMITASHNPSFINGIKIFDNKGEKLTRAKERTIENLFQELPLDNVEKSILNYAKQSDTKKGKKVVASIKLYLDTLKLHTPNLKDKKIVLDCANGAAKKIAKLVFEKTEAEVVYLNTNSGKYINQNCGAVFPKMLQQAVLKEKANVGFAFDGDADRCICVLADGSLLSGDNILIAVARYYKFKRVVGTVYSNGAVDETLKQEGVVFFRSKVGDQEVKRLMNKEGCEFGGERSGHFIFSKIMPTGDGLLSALKIASIKDLPKLQHFIKIPSKTINLSTSNKNKLVKKLQLRKSEYMAMLNGEGRVLIRASGTEPSVRVLIEHSDEEVANNIAKLLSK